MRSLGLPTAGRVAVTLGSGGLSLRIRWHRRGVHELDALTIDGACLGRRQQHAGDGGVHGHQRFSLVSSRGDRQISVSLVFVAATTLGLVLASSPAPNTGARIARMTGFDASCE